MENFNLEELKDNFENFLQKHIEEYKPIAKPKLSPEYIKEFDKQGSAWDKKNQDKISEMTENMEEDQKSKFLREIDSNWKEYNYRLTMLLNKPTATKY